MKMVTCQGMQAAALYQGISACDVRSSPVLLNQLSLPEANPCLPDVLLHPLHIHPHALCFQVIRDKKTKKSKGFGIVSLLDGGDFAKVRLAAVPAVQCSVFGQHRRQLITQTSSLLCI